MIWVRVGAVNGFIAVAAGAFAAHGLQDRLEAPMLDVFQTAARYQMYHALAILAVAWLASPVPSRITACCGGSFLVGIVVFSGSLYAYSLSSLGASQPMRIFAMITPVGGAAFLLGWLLLFVSARRCGAPAAPD